MNILTTSKINEYAQKINEYHGKLGETFKKTVIQAIKIGECLQYVKDNLPHGEFINFVGLKCEFGKNSAERYLKLFEYKSKIPNVGNLSEAYRFIESEELKNNRYEWESNNKVIQERIKTGVKPKAWNRQIEHQYKQTISDKTYEERKKEAFEKKETPKPSGDPINKILEDLVKRETERDKTKDRMKDKINMNGSQDPFFEVLEEYLESLESDSRRIEALHNLIRYGKKLVNEYQGKA